MKYKTFFFDFDGVLADSVEVKTDAFAKLFKNFGEDIVSKVIMHHETNAGMTRREKFKFYYKEFLKTSISSKELNNLCNQFSKLVVKKVIKSPNINYAGAFLEKWSNKINCFIVSATPSDEIIVIAEKREIKHYFIEILGSSKTKTQNLQYLIKKYNIIPQEALFFGDAINDYNAAKNCNVNFIGILPNKNAPLLRKYPKTKWQKDFLNIEKLF